MFKFIIACLAAIFVLSVIASHVGYAAMGQTAVVVPWVHLPLTWAACLLMAVVFVFYRTVKGK
jgi:hypothetical protein